MTVNTSPDKPTSAPILGRDDKGRFVRGNPGGSGNPFARKTAALRSALIRKMDEERIEQLADKLIEQALDGDVPSARLVLQYAIGLPTQAVDPDDVDRLEWERERRQAVPSAEVNAASGGVPVAVASMTCSFVHACEAAKMAEHLAGRIDAIDPPQAEAGEPAREPMEKEAEPVVLPLPTPVNQPARTARRCANPGRSATPTRHPTGKRGDDDPPPHPGTTERNGDGPPHFRRPEDAGPGPLD